MIETLDLGWRCVNNRSRKEMVDPKRFFVIAVVVTSFEKQTLFQTGFKARSHKKVLDA